MEFIRNQNVLICDCGKQHEISARMAAQVLGSIKTLSKANAVKRNAKMPRPSAVRLKAPSVWEQIMALPENERKLLQGAMHLLSRSSKAKLKKQHTVSKKLIPTTHDRQANGSRRKRNKSA